MLWMAPAREPRAERTTLEGTELTGLDSCAASMPLLSR
jgi:hypothetical protein